MDFKLSKEQLLIQSTAREFAEKYLEPIAERIDRENHIPEDIIKKLAEYDFCPPMKRSMVELGWL